MKIRDILHSGTRSLSFEFSPPKTDQGEEALFRTLEELKAYRPSYVSVTYGAGGSTRDKTVDIVQRLKLETGIETMAHLTCVAQSREDVHGVLECLEELGIENVLALRGDPPRESGDHAPAESEFRCAAELITYIQKNFRFGIGGACFPEGHLDSVDLATDMEYLKRKVEAGADFLVTQLFFDNSDFFDFMDRVEQTGIRVPIIVGILPILSTSQIRRFISLCGAKMPPALDDQLERFAEDDETVREIGIEHATRQVEELWRYGVAGLHFYTLNRSYSVSRILNSLGAFRD